MADEKKNINYINKDFNQFKTSLVDYAKTYFPTVYNDFRRMSSSESPGPPPLAADGLFVTILLKTY